MKFYLTADARPANSGWWQVNLEICNLSLSRVELQGVELACDLHIVQELPLSIPRLSKMTVPLLVSQSQVSRDSPIVVFLNGKGHCFVVARSAEVPAAAPFLESESVERVHNEADGNGSELSSILEH